MKATLIAILLFGAISSNLYAGIQDLGIECMGWQLYDGVETIADANPDTCNLSKTGKCNIRISFDHPDHSLKFKLIDANDTQKIEVEFVSYGRVIDSKVIDSTKAFFVNREVSLFQGDIKKLVDPKFEELKTYASCGSFEKSL